MRTVCQLTADVLQNYKKRLVSTALRNQHNAGSCAITLCLRAVVEWFLSLETASSKESARNDYKPCRPSPKAQKALHAYYRHHGRVTQTDSALCRASGQFWLICQVSIECYRNLPSCPLAKLATTAIRGLEQTKLDRVPYLLLALRFFRCAAVTQQQRRA